MRDLSEIDIWRRSFGLLPIHLNSITMEDKFLMLNGGHGDFCLQTNNIEEDRSVYFSQSWSTNTKNYVIVDNKDIKVVNWLKGNQELIPRTQIENNFDKFYSYLLSKSYKTENDVIPFIVDIFRKLRNITKEKEKPAEALNLLFRLLISLEDDYREIDSTKWDIDDITIPYQFDYFVELLKNGVNSISPQLDLILRHSAGALFQEAHKEAFFNCPFVLITNTINNKKEIIINLNILMWLFFLCFQLTFEVTKRWGISTTTLPT
jgi:adenine-specific DNA-methyltransferase